MSIRLIITLTVILSFAQASVAEERLKRGADATAYAGHPTGASAGVRDIADLWASLSRVTSVDFNAGDAVSEVRLSIKGPFRVSANRLDSPDRLFFDIERAELSDSVGAAVEINGRFIKTIRISQHEDDVVRLVLDLNSAASYEAASTDLGLNIRVYNRPAKSRGADHADSKPVAVDVHLPAPKPHFTVVIDAGHGGRDPGALGRKGAKEKKISLDIARRIRDQFRHDSRIRVKLTRDGDEHVPLSKRTMLANRVGADLFISIHANAAPNRGLNGIETWFLNATTNKEWQEVADRENAIARLDMDNLTDLDIILNDLSRSFKNSESMNLAHLLQNSMVSNIKEGYGSVHDHGVKWAKFQVLLGAKMPAALVEVGFISNSVDEKRMKSPNYRRLIARAVSSAIREYFGSSNVASLGRNPATVSVAN